MVEHTACNFRINMLFQVLKCAINELLQLYVFYIFKLMKVSTVSMKLHLVVSALLFQTQNLEYLY